MNTEEYKEFLQGRFRRESDHGFDYDGVGAETLFPFQRKIVEWACKKGRAAIFADTGLGKANMALHWADAVCRHTGGKVLILTPLAVAQQFVDEAAKFAVDGVRVAGNQEECTSRISVTNYQKLHHFNTAEFAGVVIDESSILKSFTGKTKQLLCERFAGTHYRLACTATPAPNDNMELGNHAEFLGVMFSNEMLSRWFINDPAKVGHYKLKGHAEKDYWCWVASWACCVRRPSDIGFSDEGYILSPLNIVEHVVESPLPTDGTMFGATKINATSIHREMRASTNVRADKVAEIVGGIDGPALIWCNTNYEQDALLQRIPHALDVRGSTSDDLQEARCQAFKTEPDAKLLGKPSQLGFGMNWQHCNNVVFAGLSFSFEQTYQAIRRCWRFGQTKTVNVHIVYADGESQIFSELKRKEMDNTEMQSSMVEAIRTHWNEYEPLDLSAADTIRRESGDGWELYLGDCVQSVSRMTENSIGFGIHSPPFSNLYIYSDSVADMGNAQDDAEFFKHYKYLIPELLRVTIPGRLHAVHCKDLPMYRGRDGACGLKDFPGEIIRAYTECGWIFHSRITIWKCPVVERERTNNNGLLHKTVMRDTSQVRQGMADYLLVFRKNPEGENLSAKPIVREAGFTEWPGDPVFNPLDNQFHPSKYARKGGSQANPSVRIWQRLADPVWWHIDQQDVLNVEQARSDRDEKHICPLQKGVIKEAVYLWSDEGDVVLDPFNGIGSSGVVSLELKRRYVGCELKDSYFDVSVRNLRKAAVEAKQTNLFSCLEEEEQPRKRSKAAVAGKAVL